MLLQFDIKYNIKSSFFLANVHMKLYSYHCRSSYLTLEESHASSMMSQPFLHVQRRLISQTTFANSIMFSVLCMKWFKLMLCACVTLLLCCIDTTFCLEHWQFYISQSAQCRCIPCVAHSMNTLLPFCYKYDIKMVINMM